MWASSRCLLSSGWSSSAVAKQKRERRRAHFLILMHMYVPSCDCITLRALVLLLSCMYVLSKLKICFYTPSTIYHQASHGGTLYHHLLSYTHSYPPAWLHSFGPWTAAALLLSLFGLPEIIPWIVVYHPVSVQFDGRTRRSDNDYSDECNDFHLFTPPRVFCLPVFSPSSESLIPLPHTNCICCTVRACLIATPLISSIVSLTKEYIGISLLPFVF